MAEGDALDGRALRRRLEVEQASVVSLKARAAQPVDVARLEEESRVRLAELDAALSALHRRKADAAVLVQAHAEEARRYEDTRLLLGETEQLDGLTPPLLSVVVAVLGMLLSWTIVLHPFRDLPLWQLRALCAAGVAVPLVVLPVQAWLLGRRGAAMLRRR